MDMNAIVIFFTDNLEKCDIQMSKHVEDILFLYRDKEFVFSRTKDSRTVRITIEAELEVRGYESPCA